MRMTAVISVLALCLASTVLAAEKPVTVKGEVVDTMCYSAMGARGESHAKCGLACAKAGIPVGLVEGDKMYILLPPKDGEPLPTAVAENMGKVVSVTGNVYHSGGNTFLTVQSVK
jgi:hypothetical protein